MSFAKWSRLPSRIAVLLGMGALSAAVAQPAVAEPDLGKGPTRVPQRSAKSFGEVLIWSEGGRIYFSESGNEAQELRLGDTPQARHLEALLEREGAVAGSPRVLQHRLILVGGGGSAVHWGGTQSSNVPGSSSNVPDSSSNAPPTRGLRQTSPAAGKPSEQARNPEGAKIAGTEKQK
jgi:hypothetical protein